MDKKHAEIFIFDAAYYLGYATACQDSLLKALKDWDNLKDDLNTRREEALKRSETAKKIMEKKRWKQNSNQH